ncbi:uncharacterized protein FYN12_011390 isoform 2-T2 [Phoenicopterus ruber ruber]
MKRTVFVSVATGLSRPAQAQLEPGHNRHPVPRTTPRCCSEESSHFLFLEDVAEKRLLRRARLSPKRLPAMTVKSGQGQKAEGSEPRARQLLAIQESSLKDKEEKEKLIPLAKPRTVDFIAITLERREKLPDTGCRRESVVLDCREESLHARQFTLQNKQSKKKKEKLPKHIQKYLDEEENKKRELVEEEKRKERTPPATKAKAKREKETPKVTAKRQDETQRSQESRSSEQSSGSSPTSTETEESSPDLLEMMMEEWEEAREEPPTVHEDDTVPPRRSLSPQTHQTLREVVTCLLGQVARRHGGQRDDRTDLQDKLKCELAVLQWRRSGKEAHSSQKVQEAGPQPAPPATPGKRRTGPGSCIRGTPERRGEGRKEPPVEDEESPEDKLSLCLPESSPLKRSLSPWTHWALRGAATRLLEKVEGRARCRGGEEESLSSGEQI